MSSFPCSLVSMWRHTHVLLCNTGKLMPVVHTWRSSKRFHMLPFISTAVFTFLSVLLLVSGPPQSAYTLQNLSHPFLPSSITHSRLPITNPPTLSLSMSAARTPIHIAMLFDQHRLNFTLSVVRSLMHYTASPVIFHFITPPGLHTMLHGLSRFLPRDPTIHTYDNQLCSAPVSLVAFIARHIHPSAMCKVFLADIVPVDTVLYIDSDVTVVDDVSKCYHPSTAFPADHIISMAVDMGEACQIDPDRCYPIGIQWPIPRGLECGTTPSRAQTARSEGKPCLSSGDMEPYQFNGGVALMNLGRMRSSKFTARFVQASVHTWRSVGGRQAEWGEQDLLNNFFRLYPRSVANLPCGCNFQFSAARRESKCANRTVVIAHGWTRQLLDLKSHDAFNLHFNFFRREDLDFRFGNISPPSVSSLSRIAPDWTPPSELQSDADENTLWSHDPFCSHQSHHCAFDDSARVRDVNIDISGDVVNILSRTSGRPVFYAEMSQSVREQTHPAIRHIVGTDDTLSSLTYMPPSPNRNVVVFSRSRRAFNPKDVCVKCVSPNGVCGSAPSMKTPKARQDFLDCYCGTSYPMNEYINQLHARVIQGWILYLDDDNLLLDKYVVSEFLASIKSRKNLIAFRSHLGRVTPSESSFNRERILMGDFDSSNFAFHSDNLQLAKWGGRRCGDFWLAHSLSEKLPVQWVNRVLIQANPMRPSLGGLGRRTDHGNPVVTVVVTSHLATGWRPRWVRSIIDVYARPEMRHLIHKTILVWNNPEHDVPHTLRVPQSDRFVIVRPRQNSLNNRWIDTLPHIQTDIVLNLDDDVYVDRAGLLCMINWFQRDRRRMVGPFVRRIEGTTYILDELTDSSPYSVVLPRILMLPTEMLREYAKKMHGWYHKYIDSQEAHCDDIFLNILVQNVSGKPPLRVLLPEKSIVDFYSKCYPESKNLTGGLGLQSSRVKKRSECVEHILQRGVHKPLKTSSNVATCLPRGNAVQIQSDTHPLRYKAMLENDILCG